MLGIYIACEQVMRFLISNQAYCDQFLLFCPTSLTTSIPSFVIRMIFFVTIGLMIIPFGSFIGNFSDTLIERENAAKRLQAANEELERQLVQQVEI
jgi:hypothetical protein